jgi:hypothetical protein
MVGGVWRPQTDYSDELTRETLKKDIVELIQEYKDTPGVIMFALGNESNYGLEWSASFEIENLPVGERHKEKAKYLYSLFNEIIHAGKQIDPNHPFTIVNGDIQYIDLIKEYCTDLDILGVNSYRGISFTDMWKNVKQKLDLPVVFMEFGSDAFNAVNKMEDQAAQAHLLKGMWKEIYNKSYGKGEEGLAIGGFVFEWRDEWWKYKQTENLDIQDEVASWFNGGYAFDYVEGKNNMNEEWFGICRLAEPNADGVSEAQPRVAYDVLAEIWRIDVYSENKTEINNAIDRIDMRYYTLEGDVRLLKTVKKERDKFRLSGGSLRGELVLKGKDSEIEDEGEDGLGFTNGEMLFLDFDFKPTDYLKGRFSLNILGNVADKEMETFYGGERGQSYTVVAIEDEDGVVVGKQKVVEDNERIEIYDFEATYNAEYLDFSTFYHVPRYHWGDEGDFYGLLRETTDMEGEDIWNAKAPFGWEFAGKKSLEGLKLVVGPEVYWGANPKAIVKYFNRAGRFEYALMHSEDIAQADASATDTEATEKQTRQSTLYVKTDMIPRTTLEVGGIMAATEKIDDAFDYVDGDDIVRDEIEFEDTLGIKAKATVDVFDRTKVYAAATYAGLVADGGEPIKEFGNQDPSELPYSEYGNKIEYEGGIKFHYGDFMFCPRFLYRENLIEANPAIEPSTDGTTLTPGIDPRNREDDPFAVLDNREAVSGELFVTYDPTPGTFFYDWDNDKREDARLAFNIGVNVTQYDSATDAYLFFYEEGGTNASFGEGLPDEEVWKGSSRIVFNPTHGLKIITELEAGFQQSTGAPDGESETSGSVSETREYYELEAKIIMDQRHVIEGYVKKDAWGPYDWYQQFNITYPWQYMLDYSILIDNMLDWDFSSKIGIKGIYRTLDENSPGDEYNFGENDYMFEISTYYIIEF